MENLLITPFTQKCSSEVSVPGSKSISNRAFILSAMGQASVTLKGMLVSEDVELMKEALLSLGVKIKDAHCGNDLIVKGCGGSFPVKRQEIFVGNAGTVARFLTALLAVQEDAEYKMDGTEAMRNRPMVELIDSLRELGCSFEFLKKPGCFPFVMKTTGITSSNWLVDARKSSQVLSALMMIAPLNNKKTTIQYHGGTVSEPFVDLTMGMMQAFSNQRKLLCEEGQFEYSIDGNGYNESDFVYEVEPDATAASYFLTLPLATGGMSKVAGVYRGMQQGDSRYCEVLEMVGAQISEDRNGIQSRYGDQPVGGSFDFNAISDTFLSLAAVSPLFAGSTKISGIKHTRKQETDRVSAMACELTKLGQEVIETEDALEIIPSLRGLVTAAQKGVSIDTYHDHRFAMSFAILGCHDLLGNGKPWLGINDPMCCAKTFPTFFEKLESVRLDSHQ